MKHYSRSLTRANFALSLLGKRPRIITYECAGKRYYLSVIEWRGKTFVDDDRGTMLVRLPVNAPAVEVADRVEIQHWITNGEVRKGFGITDIKPPLPRAGWWSRRFYNGSVDSCGLWALKKEMELSDKPNVLLRGMVEGVSESRKSKHVIVVWHESDQLMVQDNAMTAPMNLTQAGITDDATGVEIINARFAPWKSGQFANYNRPNHYDKARWI